MPEDDDRHMLQAIHDHCAVQWQAGKGTPLTAEQQARQRAYARVACELLRELLEEMADRLLTGGTA